MEDLVSASWLRRLIIAALLAACVLLGFRVMDPFIVPLVWAAILAFVSWPAYQWLRDKCRGHTTVAAVLMTGAMTAAVIAPLAWLAVVLRGEPVLPLPRRGATRDTAHPRPRAGARSARAQLPAGHRADRQGRGLRPGAGGPGAGRAGGTGLLARRHRGTGISGGAHQRLRADPVRRPDDLGLRRSLAAVEGQHRGGCGASDLGEYRDGLHGSHRAPVAHQPRGGDPLPGRPVRRAGGTGRIRACGALRRPRHSRGAAGDLGRVAAGELRGGPARLTSRRRFRLKRRGTSDRTGCRSPPHRRSAARSGAAGSPAARPAAPGCLPAHARSPSRGCDSETG